MARADSYDLTTTESVNANLAKMRASVASLTPQVSTNADTNATRSGERSSNVPSVPSTPSASNVPGAVVPFGGTGTGFTASDIQDAIDKAIAAATTPLQKQIETLTAGKTAGNVAQSLADAAASKQKQNWIDTAQQLVGPLLGNDPNTQTLVGKYIGYIQTGGYDSASALLKIQTEPEWNKRFSANQDRLNKGLAVLSPAEYLATEDAYRQVMISAGLPAAVYGDNTALGKLIAQDVSPAELKQRTDAAHAVIDNADPFVTTQLQTYFGLNKSDMVAHILDPASAAPVIAQKVQAAQVGAEAARAGVTGVDMVNQMSLAAAGITQADARAGFTNIAQNLQPTQTLASIYGQQQPGMGGEEAKKQLEASKFGVSVGGYTSAQAAENLKKLYGKEKVIFGGSAGADKGSLSDQSTIGAI